MAARTHADSNRYVGQVLRTPNWRVRLHVDRPARKSICIRHELAKPCPRVADAAPRAVIDNVDRLARSDEWLVLLSLQVLLALPVGHDARDNVPPDNRLDSRFLEIVPLQHNPLVQSHAGRRNLELSQRHQPDSTSFPVS